MTSFGNLELCIKAKHTDFFHFGTKRTEQKLWLWRHTEFCKKTQKTPPKEIKKAEEIRTQYLGNKTKNK